mmetsp:Transcript_18625/g.41012  ORF Transcript_18625/g.41012 Transcript_18625/m.41012 type:complete len:210 (-) Transcript_18625:161-790(-)
MALLPPSASSAAPPRPLASLSDPSRSCWPPTLTTPSRASAASSAQRRSDERGEVAIASAEPLWPSSRGRPSTNASWRWRSASWAAGPVSTPGCTTWRRTASWRISRSSSPGTSPGARGRSSSFLPLSAARRSAQATGSPPASRRSPSGTSARLMTCSSRSGIMTSLSFFQSLSRKTAAETAAKASPRARGAPRRVRAVRRPPGPPPLRR